MSKKKKKDLTLEQARELFRYENGKLYWKKTPRYFSNSINQIAGTSGRIIPRVKVNGQPYQLHRIVYLLHHGFCPKRLELKDKALTSEGMYDISIENLFEPTKKVKVKKPKKKHKEELSYFEANTYFEYKNGRLYWKKNPSKYGCIEVGQLAGSAKDRPYLRVKLHQKIYMQHRIVFLLHHKYCPQLVIFIDKTLTDEGFYDISIENLKATTISHAKSVSGYSSGKTSKFRGVYFNKAAKKYRVRISANRVRKQYGLFESEIDAAKRYDEMARMLFGEEAVLNFPEEKLLSVSTPLTSST